MSARDDLIALIEDGCKLIGHEPDIHVNDFEAEIRKTIAADVRAAAPKHLDNDEDVHVWHVLDALADEIEKGKEN